MIMENKINILTIIILLIFPSLSWAAACSGSSPNLTAASTSYVDVSACIAVATYGDTVNVPVGASNWGVNSLTIVRAIVLRGAGIGQTVITWEGTGISAIYYSPDATSLANNTPFSFSGFTMDGGNSDTNYLLSVSNLSNTTAISKVRIYNNKFSNAGTGIYIRGAVWGVAYNNQFDDCLIPFRGMGDDRDSWDYWYTSFGYGNVNSFFFEDNTIGWTHGGTSGLYGFMEIGQGGRGIIRYNTWDMTSAGGTDLLDMWDIHGNQAVDNWSGIGSEWYGNKIYNDTAVRNRRLISMRGGQNLLFNNNWTFTPGGNFGLSWWDSHADSLTPIHVGAVDCTALAECEECPIPQHISNTYIWTNLANNVNKTLDYNAAGGLACVGSVVENVQYWNYTAAFGGTTGIGCGPLVARPATCTTGVGYWATDQSCSALTGMVGASPATPISGTLYKCTATNIWTNYYTPYTYPHPLRAGDGAKSKVGTGPTMKVGVGPTMTVQ